MRRTVRTITAVLFIVVVLATGLAVLYFGTSTGIVNGGEGTAAGGATKTLPYFAQIGWLRNTAPWPVTITSITPNVAHATTVTSYIEPHRSTVAAKPNAAPIWTQTASKPPYEMVGNSLRWLAFAVTPAEGHVASFTSYTVDFTGPLGIHFSKTFSGTNVAARSSTLPPTILAPDPAVDNTSLNTYIVLLRTALEKKNDSALAVVMGGDATVADAKAFRAKEKGFSSKFTQTATPVTGNVDASTLVFIHGKTSLAPISVVWAGFRWSVTR